MQDLNTPKQAASTSVSRRNFISLATAGAAATVPAVACAAAGPTSQLPHLSLEQQLDACVAELRAILAKMHPVSHGHRHFLSSREDGSFYFNMMGEIEFGSFDGDGVYEISVDGILCLYWLEKDYHRYRVTGKPVPGRDFYWTSPWENGAPRDEMRRMVSPSIVRKLPEAML